MKNSSKIKTLSDVYDSIVGNIKITNKTLVAGDSIFNFAMQKYSILNSYNCFVQITSIAGTSPKLILEGSLDNSTFIALNTINCVTATTVTPATGMTAKGIWAAVSYCQMPYLRYRIDTSVGSGQVITCTFFQY